MTKGLKQEIKHEEKNILPKIDIDLKVSVGQYNLILGVIGQSVDVLHRYLNYCGPTNKKGILHSAAIFASDLIIPKYVPLNLFSQESQEHKCGNICKNCSAYLDGKCNGCGAF